MEIWKTFHYRKRCNPKNKAHRIQTALRTAQTKIGSQKPINQRAKRVDQSLMRVPQVATSLARKPRAHQSRNSQLNTSRTKAVAPLSRRGAGRSGEADGTRGGLSPRPAAYAGARCIASRTLLLGRVPLCDSALATLHSNAPHRSPSLRYAHRLRSFPRRPLLENLLRRRIPFGNPCKLLETCGNIAKANYLCFRACRTYRDCGIELVDVVSLSGFRALRKNRVGDSLAPSEFCLRKSSAENARGRSGIRRYLPAYQPRQLA